MIRQTIAAMISAALITTQTAPAFAGEAEREQLGRLLFGLAAVAAIGHIVKTERARAPQQETATRQSPRADEAVRNQRHVVPRSCLRDVETRYGHYRMFGENCMQRRFDAVDRLPDHCVVRVYTTEGPRSGYDPDCLHANGYRASRRQH